MKKIKVPYNLEEGYPSSRERRGTPHEIGISLRVDN